jgi:hypothetical protein
MSILTRLGRIPMPTWATHRSQTIAVQCRHCGQWRKPSDIRIPGLVCRDCETTPAFQSWKPTRRQRAAANAAGAPRALVAASTTPVRRTTR